MSRIGRLPIDIPSGVTVEVAGQNVAVKGPKGELQLTVAKPIAVEVEEGQVVVSRADDERVVRLHPADIELVSPRLKADWTVQPDPSLERGTVRVETATGGVEDGPAAWRMAIAEALHQALRMPRDEQRERMRSMRRRVRDFNVYRWAGRMLQDAARLRQRERVKSRIVSLSQDRVRRGEA